MLHFPVDPYFGITQIQIGIRGIIQLYPDGIRRITIILDQTGIITSMLSVNVEKNQQTIPSKLLPINDFHHFRRIKICMILQYSLPINQIIVIDSGDIQMTIHSRIKKVNTLLIFYQ